MRNHFTAQLMEAALTENKRGMIQMVSQIMPDGEPDFSIIRLAPSIKQILKENEADDVYDKMLTALCMIVKDYCDSVNIPEGKNMNQAQVIEAASFLLDECDNYRIEDYIMMFTMAKRNKLAYGAKNDKGRVFDRVDIQLISEFKERYEFLRQEGEDKLRIKEEQEQEKLLPPDRQIDPDEPDEVKAKRWDDALAHLEMLRAKWRKEKEEKFEKEHAERKRRYEIFKEFYEEPDHEKALQILAKRNSDNNQNTEP